MNSSFKVLPLIASLAAVSAFAQVPAEITPPAGNKAVLTLAATGDLGATLVVEPGRSLVARSGG